MNGDRMVRYGEIEICLIIINVENDNILYLLLNVVCLIFFHDSLMNIHVFTVNFDKCQDTKFQINILLTPKFRMIV